jgi:hypothetical protein
MTAEHDAIRLLRSVCTPAGIVASTLERANYRRVWARDAVVCGLAGLAAGDEVVIEGLRRSLDTLGGRAGRDGQIPSNVDPNSGHVSYGGLAGRVDPNPWFVIGVCALAARDETYDPGPHLETMQGALEVLGVWEFNRRGYIWVPQGGDWADEYVLQGYVLYDQLLRLWALRLHAEVVGAPTSREAAEMLAGALKVDFRPDGTEPARAYHQGAYRRWSQRHGSARHWLASLSPGGYVDRFDTWSNAIAVLLGLGDIASPLDEGESIRNGISAGLPPAFWPPIDDDDPMWFLLQEASMEEFRNEPGRYHNGGLWPVVSGFWGAALYAAGRTDAARDVLEAIRRANAHDFPEFIDAYSGEPGGVTPLGWSAAGEVLLESAIASHVPGFFPTEVA